MGFYEAKTFHDNISDTKNVGEFVVIAFDLTVDVIKDTIKYILIALLISIISIFIYVWGLHKPERWKSYSLLILGIALAWISLFPSEELAKSYAGPGIIMQLTIVAIAHLYIITSIWQFVHSIDHKDYFLEDKAIQERIQLDKRVDRLISYKNGSNRSFQDFLKSLSWSSESEYLKYSRFFIHWWNGILSGSAKTISDSQINECLDAVWQNWPKDGMPNDEIFGRIVHALPEIESEFTKNMKSKV